MRTAVWFEVFNLCSPGGAIAMIEDAPMVALEWVRHMKRGADCAKRGALAHHGPDKTDLAGALLRQEVRGWLRGLPASERTAMLVAPGGLDPVVSLAIAEAPAVLSGVSAEQRTRLLDRAIDAANPHATLELAELEAAAEVVGNAETHLARTLGELTGLGASEVDALAHRADPPKLRHQPGHGALDMVLTRDPAFPTGWRPAKKHEIAAGVYEVAAP